MCLIWPGDSQELDSANWEHGRNNTVQQKQESGYLTAMGRIKTTPPPGREPICRPINLLGTVPLAKGITNPVTL